MGIYKRSENWYVDYYARGHRQREKIGPSKKLAETVLKKRKVEIAENKFLDIRKEKKVRFTDLAETFLNDYFRSNDKKYQNNKAFVKNLAKFFGDKYLYEINSLLIEKYKSERLQSIKPVSINRELAILKSMFNRAIEWDMLSNNPAKSVKNFPADDKRVRFLTIEEINRLLSVCSGYLSGIVVLALNTGMRKGEILGLRWENVDSENSVIYIPSSLSKNKCRREIPMNAFVKKTLKELKKYATSPYVFCKADGSPLGSIRKSYATALEKANIKDFRFHDLRHTFCSQLVKGGTDIYTVMELAGHKSIKMTMRYAHLTPNQKNIAVEALSSRMVTNWSQSH